MIPPPKPDARIELPAQLPVMFLPGAVLLPNFLMPLLIFEPRYRAMLEHALEHDRMFCVAQLQAGRSEARGPGDFFPICGAGLVRASVGHEDGTSHLVLQGLARVELAGFTQEKPFRIAQIRELRPSAAPGPVAEHLAAEVRRFCAAHPMGEGMEGEKLEAQILESEDPGALADLVARLYLRDAAAQQEILEAVEIEKRLRLLIRHLREEQG